MRMDTGEGNLRKVQLGFSFSFYDLLSPLRSSRFLTMEWSVQGEEGGGGGGQTKCYSNNCIRWLVIKFVFLKLIALILFAVTSCVILWPLLTYLKRTLILCQFKNWLYSSSRLSFARLVCLSFYLQVTDRLNDWPSDCLSAWPPAHLSDFFTVCSSFSLSICLSVCLSVGRSLCLVTEEIHTLFIGPYYPWHNTG